MHKSAMVAVYSQVVHFKKVEVCPCIGQRLAGLIMIRTMTTNIVITKPTIMTPIEHSQHIQHVHE